ncbi:hypothetical protein AQS8620_02920 [Aquimixticola soesokkakensis]|uniref:Uncharacterized protein n=1 Tax=Aquimixticola soesokkakensis TaxID=1519096 RepID=A0A1Y5TGP0_9RHOB|nr:hypothetical protein [Aquimixticola soesokkakensis]SLN63760.1 hypothetical protein AQS8620_02920 [Aquimixticola soesokkakensis]
MQDVSLAVLGLRLLCGAIVIVCHQMVLGMIARRVMRGNGVGVGGAAPLEAAGQRGVNRLPLCAPALICVLVQQVGWPALRVQGCGARVVFCVVLASLGMGCAMLCLGAAAPLVARALPDLRGAVLLDGLAQVQVIGLRSAVLALVPVAPLAMASCWCARARALARPVLGGWALALGALCLSLLGWRGGI